MFLANLFISIFNHTCAFAKKTRLTGRTNQLRRNFRERLCRIWGGHFDRHQALADGNRLGAIRCEKLLADDAQNCCAGRSTRTWSSIFCWPISGFFIISACLAAIAAHQPECKQIASVSESDCPSAECADNEFSGQQVDVSSMMDVDMNAHSSAECAVCCSQCECGNETTLCKLDIRIACAVCFRVCSKSTEHLCTISITPHSITFKRTKVCVHICWYSFCVEIKNRS